MLVVTMFLVIVSGFAYIGHVGKVESKEKTEQVEQQLHSCEVKLQECLEINKQLR